MMKIKPYLDALDIFEKLCDRSSELSDKDLGLIGGIIEKYRPTRILEIGVAGGGTTCFVLNCLKKLELDSKMYSVDISYTFHLNQLLDCGYQIKAAKELLQIDGQHKLYLGKPIAAVINEIIEDSGRKIDLLILDTSHYMPGEVLDFLICLPFLSANAIVVLDDQLFAFEGENRMAFCTRVLNSCVMAERMCVDDFYTDKMIALFLNEYTKKSIENLWLSLMIPWEYSLGDYEENYKEVVKNYYSPEEYNLFCKALEINSSALQKRAEIPNEINKIICKVKQSRRTFIFGCGQRGQALQSFLEDRGMATNGFLVSDGREHEIKNVKATAISAYKEIADKSNDLIILAAADETAKYNLDRLGIDYYETPGYIFPFIKQYALVMK